MDRFEAQTSLDLTVRGLLKPTEEPDSQAKRDSTADETDIVAEPAELRLSGGASRLGRPCDTRAPAITGLADGFESRLAWG